jgi:hypothetical protein
MQERHLGRPGPGPVLSESLGDTRFFRAQGCHAILFKEELLASCALLIAAGVECPSRKDVVGPHLSRVSFIQSTCILRFFDSHVFFESYKRMSDNLVILARVTSESLQDMITFALRTTNGFSHCS